MKHLLFSLLTFVFMLSTLQAQRLNDGDKAPSIVTTDVKGNAIHLKKIAKDKKVLLVFLRYAWCPICNLRTHELIQNYDALKEKGYEIIAFYQSPLEKMKEYVEDRQIPFPVVADFEGKFYQLYQLEYNMEKVQKSMEMPEFQARIPSALSITNMEEDQTKYGVEKENADALIPGDFVIDKKGKIERAYYGKFFGDHLHLEDLK